MPDDARDILALYDWTAGGDCFRCARKGVDTTEVDEITPRSGERVTLLACQRCVVILERQRARSAQRDGEPYTPGRLRARQP
jgi:hypothetical protein